MKGDGEVNAGEAIVSATASAALGGAAMIGCGAATGCGGIAGRGNEERPAAGAAGHDGAMNGAGVMVVATSSKCPGAFGGREETSAPR